MTFRSEFMTELDLDILRIVHIDCKSMAIKFKVFELTTAFEQSCFFCVGFVSTFNISSQVVSVTLHLPL